MNWIKGLKNTIGIIILGAFGSGFWEKVFAPSVNYIFFMIMEFMKKISKSFENSIYLQASYGFREYYSFILFITLYFILFMIYVVLYVKLKDREKFKESLIEDLVKKDNNEDDCNLIENGTINKKVKINKIKIIISATFTNSKFVLLLTVMVGILTSFQAAKQNLINQIIVETNNNIEIVSPYISENEYKELKAMFYSMESKNDYDKLIKALSQYAHKKNIHLKKVPLIK